MRILLFANTDWYLFNFRSGLAMALRDAGHDVLLVSPGGKYERNLRELGLRWVAAPMERRSLNPLKEAALVIWLWRLVRRERVDLVHGFTIKCAVYGSLVARLTSSSRSVFSVDGMGYVFTSRDMRARLLRPLVRLLIGVVLSGGKVRVTVQNPDDAAFFDESGMVNKGKLRLIPGSGVDCRRYSASSIRAEEETMRVLLATRLLWDKGLGEFVAAAHMLRNQGRKIQFVLAGSPDAGNPSSVPLDTVRSWVRAELVEWLGHVDDMPALLSSVHLVVLPSYREGLPKILIEAGACGLPIVATDVPGCRDVVTHEVDGLLVPPRDAAALALAIVRLQDDPRLAARLGSAARVRAKATFDESKVVQQLFDVYAELMV